MLLEIVAHHHAECPLGFVLYPNRRRDHMHTIAHTHRLHRACQQQLRSVFCSQGVMRLRLRLALMLLSVSLAPMAVALQDPSGAAHEKAGGTEAFFDASPPLANASFVVPHVTRRLSTLNPGENQTTLNPGDNLQAAVDAAQPGDVIVLNDGTYTGSGTSEMGANMLKIDKNIAIRAANPGMAVLDGESARRVMYIASGVVVLDGLNITNGQVMRTPQNTVPSPPWEAHFCGRVCREVVFTLWADK